ncbi:hypothetical protein PRZ48_009093 [Zasmidium cellare]|uniref:Cytochrome P450 n=1 Tax=Zasmidium cellare TaxID=395010 RepID=A0ABR0EI33_ZASCE|nr:hypothetical protein PRZ48_009093 [Zasmidium cellare]
MFIGPGYKAPPIRTDMKSKYHNVDTSDLDKFRPERWLKETAEGTLEFDSSAAPTLQFGAGFRGCFGRKFAYLELRMFIVLLVLSFEFLPPAPELRTHEAFDKLGHCPKNCYVRLRSLRKDA